MRTCVSLSATLAIVAGSFFACADEPVSVFSGPQVGESLPPLAVSLAYGDKTGNTVDFVEQAAGMPTLLVIVNGANRPAAGLTRALMNFSEMQGDHLFAGVVYLDGDLSAAEKYLHRAVSWWGVAPPVGVSVDGAEGPGSYGLNRNVNLTILVAVENRVRANFALVQPSLTDGPKILEEVKRLVEFRIPTDAEMAFLSIPTQKSGEARWEPAPSDIEMRRLICDALAADDDDEASKAASAVEIYVGDNSQRQAILGRASSALLHQRGYTGVRDIPIVKHLKRWRKDYGPPPDRQNRKKS